jgi:hypothetical protein
VGLNACEFIFFKDFIAIDRVIKCNFDTFATDFDAGEALRRLRRQSQHYSKNSNREVLDFLDFFGGRSIDRWDTRCDILCRCTLSQRWRPAKTPLDPKMGF